MATWTGTVQNDFPVGTYPAGTIYNADIMFDSSKNPTVSGEDFTNDIRMIALHEIGHFDRPITLIHRTGLSLALRSRQYCTRPNTRRG